MLRLRRRAGSHVASQHLRIVKAKWHPRTLDIPYLLDGAFYRMSCLAWGDPHAPARHLRARPDSPRARFRRARPRPGAGFLRALSRPPRRAAARTGYPRRAPLPAAKRTCRRSPTCSPSSSARSSGVGTSLGGICGMLIARRPRPADPPHGAQRYRPLHPQSLARPHRQLRRQTPRTSPTKPPSKPICAASTPPSANSPPHNGQSSPATPPRTLPDGRPALHYDPAIAQPMQTTEPQDINLWPFWAHIDIPLLHPARRVERPAAARNPGADVRQIPNPPPFPGAGHAPALLDAPYHWKRSAPSSQDRRRS